MFGFGILLILWRAWRRSIDHSEPEALDFMPARDRSFPVRRARAGEVSFGYASAIGAVL